MQKAASSTVGLSFDCVWREKDLPLLLLFIRSPVPSDEGHTLMIPLNPNYLLKALCSNTINYIGV